MRRARLAAVAMAAALATAGCTSAAGSDAPTFVPSPGGFPSEGPGVTISPIVPEPPAPGGSGGGAGGSGSGTPGGPSSSSTPKVDPLVVATKLTSPVGVAILPDGSALVGERTTGRIVHVQATAGEPTPTVKTLTGLDTAGGGGLLDLAVSPEYTQDNLVYAYISTAKDNRVVEFTLGGPVTPIITGIPHGTSDNGGRLQFAADGTLYVSTGDAGNAALAANPASLAGKVLRVDSIGQPAAGNPRTGSAVVTTGATGLTGICLGSGTPPVVGVAPASGGGQVEVLPSGGTATRVTSLPATTTDPGDCAISSGVLWVTSLDGESVLSATLTAGSGSSVTIGKFGATFVRKYGRLRTIVAAPDGSLWATTSNRDGQGTPVAADERVIHFMPSSASNPSSDLR